MHSPAIVPAPPKPAIRKITADGPRLRAVSSASARLLKDATVAPLSAVDTTKTVLATLLGRGNDAVFNARVISTVNRLGALAHVGGVVLVLTGISLAFAPDTASRTALTSVAMLAGCFQWTLIASSLSWDVLQLIVRTFEFWFLIAVNVHNVWLWMALFTDVRSLGFAILGANFVLTLCTDANIYTRRMFTRLTVLASPSLLVVLVATMLDIPPDVEYPQYQVAGLTVDALDLLMSGNLTIAYFTAIRVYRSQHLVFSKGPIERVVCDMYFPTCHLVHQSASRYSSVMASASTDGRHLELIQNPSARGIDAVRSLVPRLTHWMQYQHPTATRLVVPVGSIGLVTSVAGFVALTVDMNHEILSSARSRAPVEGISVGCTLFFVAISAAHWQPVLTKRICFEIDVWFVLIQVTLVSWGVCDALRWATRPTALVGTAWLWCLWVLFLDAVPAPTRRRLAFSKPFAVLVILCLGAFPITVAYWVYFSPSHKLVRNRVLMNLCMGSKGMEVNVLGFMSSKLFTLWIWMGRFLWRELFRPCDAFKVIKRRVFYRVLPY